MRDGPDGLVRRASSRHNIAVGYFVLVIAQTIVLPVVSGAIQLVAAGGDAVLVFGRWWVFWGVGSRLLVAGIAQVSGRGPTSAILGTDTPSVQERQLVRELGTANIALGAAGLLALVPGWALPTGAAGGLFLLIAGLMHAPKRGKNPQESLATWTDILVGVAVAVLAVYTVVTGAVAAAV